MLLGLSLLKGSLMTVWGEAKQRGNRSDGVEPQAELPDLCVTEFQGDQLSDLLFSSHLVQKASSLRL